MRKRQFTLFIVGLLLAIIGELGIAFNLWLTSRDTPFDSIDANVPESFSTETPSPTFTPAATPTLMSTPQVEVVGKEKPAYYKEVSFEPELTAIPTPKPVLVPDRVNINTIGLDTPVVANKLKTVEYEGNFYKQWSAPNMDAAGWITTSATLEDGNTVLVGHSSGPSVIFNRLEDLKVGDVILVYSGNTAYAYTVSVILLLPERWQSLDVRLANARWLDPTVDSRLTLVTCWPNGTNIFRLVVVALPVSGNLKTSYTRY